MEDNMSNTLTQLTIAQIQKLQQDRSIFAVGKYQGVPQTLASWIRTDNINTAIKFDATEQERFGTYLLSKKRPIVNQYVTRVPGVTIEQAQLELAREFASVPVATRITRPPKAGGARDPGGIVEAGQSYYQGLAGNKAKFTSEQIQAVLRNAASGNNLQTVKDFVSTGEGTYESINIIPNIGDIAKAPRINSTEYFQALNGAGAEAWKVLPPRGAGTGTSATAVSSAGTSYFENTYIAPLRPLTTNVAIGFRLAISGQKISDAIPNPRVTVGGRTFRDVVESGTGNNGGLMDISGELLLLGSVNSINVEYQEQQKSIQSRVDGLLPAEAAFVVQYDLFEFFPDKMREKMSINAAEGINANYSHAWRSPGKLAITANLTIPGASGFRIGQVFWIGRTYEHYKKEGAFQLFGLTETIDLSRGWTTELYARFNAIPRSVIATAKSV